MKESLSFVNFNYLTEDVLLEILEHRNATEIRMQMRNTEIISREDHLRFCKSLKDSNTRFYYAIYHNDKLIGVIDYNLLDEVKRTYESGSYFFDDPSVVRTHANLAGIYICIEKRLYIPKNIVKKNNIQAVLFNTMKLGMSIDSEDDEYYHLSAPSHELNSKESEEHYTQVMNKLYERYDLSFKL